jgi:hypothetical protein
VSLEVNNQSKREIKTVSVGFQRDCVCHAQGRRKLQRDLFGVTSLPPIAPRATPHQAQVPFQVPAACPSIMAGGSCRIIEIKYFLRLKIKAGGFTRSKYLTIPIVVGLVPLKSTQTITAIDYSLQACSVSKEAGVTLGTQEGGESLQSNLNTYKPVYPFYDNLPQQTHQQP